MNEVILPVIEDLIDEYCLDDCTSNDGKVCDDCHMRKFMDKIHTLKERKENSV